MVTEAQVWDALAEIPDPEIPVISLVDLGVVRGVAVDGERVRRVPLVTGSDVPEAGTVRVLVSVLGVPLTLLLVLAILLGAVLVVVALRTRVKLVRQ